MPLIRRTTVVPALAVLVTAGLALPAEAAAPDLTETRTFTVADPYAAGYALDLDGDLAAYTGSYRSGSAAGTGLVQVARWSGPAETDWTTSDLPVPADARGFGVAVAVDEAAGRVAVGAIGSQQVVVYAQTGPDAWEVDRVLTAPADPRVSQVRSFGESLALDGDTLVVGAPNSWVDGRANAGLAYVFDLGTGTTTPLLPPVDLVVDDAIAGQAVAVGDGRIAVGAPQLRQTLDYYGGAFRVGGVYLWDTRDLAAGPSVTTQPVGPEMRSVPPGTGGGAGFGFSIAFVGERLYVGSPLEVNYTADDPDDPSGGYNTASIDEGTTTQGAVYVYDAGAAVAPTRVGGKLMPPAHSWGFGYQIDATDDVLLASAYRTEDDRRGEVYVLDPDDIDPAVPDDGGLLRQVVEPVQVLRGSDMEPGARFGSSEIGGGTAVSGDRALVSAFAAGASASGKVYLFGSVSAVGPVAPDPAEVDVPDVSVGYGGSATLTATVDGLVPARATVTVGGADVAGAALDGGALSLTLGPAAFPAGDHAVVVSVFGDGDDEPAAVGTATLRVLPAATVTTIGPAGPPRPGASLLVTGTVVAEHGTAPTGAVEVLADDVVVATVEPDASGGFAADLPGGVVAAGARTLEARYAGDANHLASTGTAAATVPAAAEQEPAPDPTPGAASTRTPGRAGGAGGLLATTGPGGLVALTALAAGALAGGTALVRRARRG